MRKKTIASLIAIVVIVYSVAMFIDYVEYVNKENKYSDLPTPSPTPIKERESTPIADYDQDGIPNYKDSHLNEHEELYQYASDYGLSEETIKKLASLKPSLHNGHLTDDFKEYIKLLGEVNKIDKEAVNVLLTTNMLYKDGKITQDEKQLVEKTLILDDLASEFYKIPEVYTKETPQDEISKYVDLVYKISQKDQDAAKWVLGMGEFIEDKKISNEEQEFVSYIVQNKPDLLRILVSKDVIDGITNKDLDWAKGFSPQKGEFGYLTDDLYNLPDIKDGFDEQEKEAVNEFKGIVESSKTDYELKKGLYEIDEYGVPDQSMFKYDVPEHNTQLQVLLHLLEDRNVPEEYKRIALAAAIDYGAVITIGDENVKQQVRKYVPETIDFIIETDEVIKDNGADWQAKDYPLEADVGLVWGAGGTMLPIPYDEEIKGSWGLCLSWENTFRDRQMDLEDFKWSFVSRDTLKEMRDFMINEGHANENIEKYIDGGYKGSFFHPGKEKSFEPLIIDGKKVFIKHNTNPDWQWEHYKKEGYFLGICLDRALVEKTLGKSINIDSIMGHVLIPKDNHIRGHTFALFYDQDNDALKTVPCELVGSIKDTVNEDTTRGTDNYYYGHIHTPWDNLRNKYVWDKFYQEKITEDDSSVSTIPVEGIPHGYIWRKAWNHG